jgi:ABC-type antimicrobial peptide transport system permease subunit
MATFAGVFSALALLFAAIGLYGLLTYTVVQRTSEIGVRLALGARPSQVLTLVISDAVWMLMTVIGIGLPIAWAGITSRVVDALRAHPHRSADDRQCATRATDHCGARRFSARPSRNEHRPARGAAVRMSVSSTDRLTIVAGYRALSYLAGVRVVSLERHHVSPHRSVRSASSSPRVPSSCTAFTCQSTRRNCSRNVR